MHTHGNMPVRQFLVTLMDDTLPRPQVFQIRVDSPCDCDLWVFVSTLPGLPFTPAFMAVQESPIPRTILFPVR